MDTSLPTDGSTSPASLVNSTSAAAGVNAAQAQQIIDTSGLIAQYEQRIRSLMSDKDKSINERNQAIAQLTELQKRYTEQQEQTQSSLTSAANAAQQAIDRAQQLEQQVSQATARNAKLSALMQRPHLVAYEALIPEQADEEKLKAVLDQLEQIRAQDMKQYAPALPQQQQQPQGLSLQQQQASTLQSLYGNRASMNPAFQSPQIPIPASSPAQMTPMGAPSTDIVSAINQLYAEAKAKGTSEAFEDATRRAALLANSQPR